MVRGLTDKENEMLKKTMSSTVGFLRKKIEETLTEKHEDYVHQIKMGVADMILHDRRNDKKLAFQIQVQIVNTKNPENNLQRGEVTTIDAYGQVVDVSSDPRIEVIR